MCYKVTLHHISTVLQSFLSLLVLQGSLSSLHPRLRAKKKNKISNVFLPAHYNQLCTRIRRYYRISSSTNLVTEYISPLSANVEASYQCRQIKTSCKQESCGFLNMCLWHMADKNNLKISLQKVNIWIFKQL